MYAAIQGANSVLMHSFRKDTLISPLKLQKLVYLVHGWYLACFDEPTFHENPQVWTYGPVFPEIYRDYKIFGSLPISKENWDVYGTPEKGNASEDDRNFHEVLEQVWELYSPYSGLHLSELTHREGTPWSLARERGDVCLNQEEIKQHFKSLMNA